MYAQQAGAPTSRSLFKNMLQGSGLYSIAIVGQRLVGLVLLPITTRFLTPADYGVLDLLEQVGSFLSFLLGGNFSSALGYFYFETDSPAARRRVITTTVIGALLIGLAAGALCWPFAHYLARSVFGTETAAYSLYIVFITMPPTFLLEALLGWLRVENRPGLWVLGSLLRLGVTAIGVIVLVAVLRQGVLGVQYTALAAALLPGLGFGAYAFAKNRSRFDARLFLRLGKFAAPLGLSGVAMFIINFGDRFVLRRYDVSFAELGLYALAYKIGMLISAIYASFQIYWSAQVFGIMRRDDADAVFGRVSTYVVLGVAFSGLGIVVCSKPALRLAAAPAYYGAASMVPILVAAYCIRSVGEFFRCLFLAAGRPSYDAACAWIGTVVCLAGYFLLIPRFGVWGAAGATLITFVVLTAVAVVWSYRLRPYRLETARLAKIGAALAATAIPYALFPMNSLAAQIGWAILLALAFPAVLLALRFPTPGETAVALGAARYALRRVNLLSSPFTAKTRGRGDLAK